MQFANDTTLLIRLKEEIACALNEIEILEWLSGLMLNRKKTQRGVDTKIKKKAVKIEGIKWDDKRELTRVGYIGKEECHHKRKCINKFKCWLYQNLLP